MAKLTKKFAFLNRLHYEIQNEGDGKGPKMEGFAAEKHTAERMDGRKMIFRKECLGGGSQGNSPAPHISPMMPMSPTSARGSPYRCKNKQVPAQQVLH